MPRTGAFGANKNSYSLTIESLHSKGDIIFVAFRKASIEKLHEDFSRAPNRQNRCLLPATLHAEMALKVDYYEVKVSPP